jgi:hypothetical protein
VCSSDLFIGSLSSAILCRQSFIGPSCPAVPISTSRMAHPRTAVDFFAPTYSAA